MSKTKTNIVDKFTDTYTTKSIPLDNIDFKYDPYEFRTETKVGSWDNEEVLVMTDTIKAGVILPPPTLTKDMKDPKKESYLIVDGRRRLLAHKRLGTKEVLCSIVVGSSAELYATNLEINSTHGKPPTYIERKNALIEYFRMLDKDSGALPTQEIISKRFGLSQSVVSKCLTDAKQSGKVSSNLKSSKGGGRPNTSKGSKGSTVSLGSKTPKSKSSTAIAPDQVLHWIEALHKGSGAVSAKAFKGYVQGRFNDAQVDGLLENIEDVCIYLNDILEQVKE